MNNKSAAAKTVNSDHLFEPIPEGLCPSAIIFRSAIPGSPSVTEAVDEIARWSGGWFFTEPETQQRMWVSDSNTIGVKFG